MDRNRPYDGQSHMGNGERGKTLVEGLTMRDVADCIIFGFLKSNETPYRTNEAQVVYDTMCEIEKRMGIYPNIPALHSIQDVERTIT